MEDARRKNTETLNIPACQTLTSVMKFSMNLKKPQHSQNSLIAKLLEESAKLLKIFLLKMSQGSVEL